MTRRKSFHRSRITRLGETALALACGVMLASAALAADGSADRAEAALRGVPENLGRGLYPMVGALHEGRLGGKAESEAIAAALKTAKLAQVDRTQRVLVDVCLDGRATLAEITKECGRRGGQVIAQINWYRKGLLSAWLPLAEVEGLAVTRGVSAVHLAPRRHLRVGATTTQGATVLNTAAVNALGYQGTGVTIGVMSDSYNDDEYDKNDPGWTTPTQDVKSGDLPGTGNPLGHTTPVKVVADETDGDGTDEGRAMLQIVEDVAPAAKLAFCTVGNTDAEFASNIAKLQSTAGCQVMCDDVGFFDEPMFSDGVVAQAVNAVAAKGVSYFSAIGNDGNSGYAATFVPVSNTVGLAQAAAEGVVTSSIPPAEQNVISQWHGFGTDAGGNPVVVQNITTGYYPMQLIFQWDDPFDVTNGTATGITTDFDILVFNGNTGEYISGLSGTTNNISTNEPLELPGATFAENNSNYKICIVLTNRTNGSLPQLATHLRYIATDDYDTITGDYINLSNVAAFGHCCASGCTGVAAYVYDVAPPPAGVTGQSYRPLVESYSSNGPIDIYFDSAGNRLSSPVTRKQPVLAGVDNVDTTFFPPSPTTPNPADYEFDGFPNFAGTSAATPHAAGIAALLISAAKFNGLGTLSPQYVQTLMASTAQGQIDEDPIFCQATAGPVTVAGAGDDKAIPNSMQITFNGTGGQKLTKLVIDLSPVSMHFDVDTTGNGEAFMVNSTSGPTMSSPVFSSGASGVSQSAATFSFTGFTSGNTVNFSIGFDDDDTGLYGYDADELGTATITATVSGVGTPYTGTFTNKLGVYYNYKAGFGLIDAQAAVNLLLGN